MCVDTIFSTLNAVDSALDTGALVLVGVASMKHSVRSLQQISFPVTRAWSARPSLCDVIKGLTTQLSLLAQ